MKYSIRKRHISEEVSTVEFWLEELDGCIYVKARCEGSTSNNVLLTFYPSGKIYKNVGVGSNLGLDLDSDTTCLRIQR